MRRFSIVCFLAGCANNLPTQDQVQDLRILGMRSDPPEQVVSFDAGAPPEIVAVTTTALLADPHGNGRHIHGVFATCAAVDPATQQCLSSSTDFAVLAELDVTLDGGPSAEMNTSFLPSQQLLADALANDPEHGAGYLPLPVQLTISAGTESVTGVKLEFFTPPVGNPPHVNPIIPLVTLNGQPWDAGAIASLVPPIVDGGDLIDPVTPTGLEQSYREPTYSGKLATFTEDWSYAFYCTAGQFQQPTSGGDGVGVQAGQQQPTTDLWTGDAGASELVYFWIVVDDGHGGQNWTTRLGQE